MKKIMFHVPSNIIAEKLTKICRNNKINIKNIDKYILENNIVNMVDFSYESYFVIKEFMKNNWECYITGMDSIDIKKLNFKSIYDVKKGTVSQFNIEKLNKKIDIMFVKVVGDVFRRVEYISEYLTNLNDNFNGIIINNPKAMLKGMDKRYLIDLIGRGMSVIDTTYFKKDISFNDIDRKIKNKKDYIIKPINGELSTNLSQLDCISEEILRNAESSVEGWIMQPYMKEIWNGEYQMFFIGDKYIRAQKKEYSFVNEDEKNKAPNQGSRKIIAYIPIKQEIKKALEYKREFEKLYDTELLIWRCDYIKDKNNEVKLLELETVNPGWFFRYISIEEKKYFVKIIFDYIENMVDSNKTEYIGEMVI